MLEVGLGLAGQPDKGENLNRIAQSLGIQIGVIAADDSRFLEPADTAKAGRRRNAGALCQIHIGHASVILQIAENLPVDRVELHLSCHDVPYRIV